MRIESNGEGLGFDFAAIYTQIKLNRLIEFQDDDGRMVRLDFVETDTGVTIDQTFDAESTTPEEEPRAEWQAVLDRFSQYVENQYHVTQL